MSEDLFCRYCGEPIHAANRGQHPLQGPSPLRYPRVPCPECQRSHTHVCFLGEGDWHYICSNGHRWENISYSAQRRHSLRPDE